MNDTYDLPKTIPTSKNKRTMMSYQVKLPKSPYNMGHPEPRDLNPVSSSHPQLSQILPRQRQQTAFNKTTNTRKLLRHRVKQMHLIL